MDATERLLADIAAEVDDVLAAVVWSEGAGGIERLWARLVDLLVEGMFVDLRRQHLRGARTAASYAAEVTELAARCRAAGLLPLGSRRAG